MSSLECDPKTAEFAGWLLITDVNFIDLGRSIAPVTPSHGLTHGGLFTLKDCFYPAIPQVPDPAGQAQILGLVLGVPAKADSLDAARDINVGPNELCIDLIGHL